MRLLSGEGGVRLILQRAFVGLPRLGLQGKLGREVFSPDLQKNDGFCSRKLLDLGFFYKISRLRRKRKMVRQSKGRPLKCDVITELAIVPAVLAVPFLFTYFPFLSRSFLLNFPFL